MNIFNINFINQSPDIGTEVSQNFTFSVMISGIILIDTIFGSSDEPSIISVDGISNSLSSDEYIYENSGL